MLLSETVGIKKLSLYEDVKNMTFILWKFM